MDHEFSLKKPLPTRAQPDWTIRPCAEQVALVHWITAQVLRLLMDYIDETEQNAIFGSEAPIHLFEPSEELCGIFGLDKGCAVLFDLFDVSPKLIWSNEDFGVLQRMPVARLQTTCRSLAKHSAVSNDFLRLTMDVCFPM
jgi:hypothetical protein